MKDFKEQLHALNSLLKGEYLLIVKPDTFAPNHLIVITQDGEGFDISFTLSRCKDRGKWDVKRGQEIPAMPFMVRSIEIFEDQEVPFDGLVGGLRIHFEDTHQNQEPLEIDVLHNNCMDFTGCDVEELKIRTLTKKTVYKILMENGLTGDAKHVLQQVPGRDRDDVQLLAQLRERSKGVLKDIETIIARIEIYQDTIAQLTNEKAELFDLHDSLTKTMELLEKEQDNG